MTDHLPRQTTDNVRPQTTSEHRPNQNTYHVRPHTTSAHKPRRTTDQIRPQTTSDHRLWPTTDNVRPETASNPRLRQTIDHARPQTITTTKTRLYMCLGSRLGLSAVLCIASFSYFSYINYAVPYEMKMLIYKLAKKRILANLNCYCTRSVIILYAQYVYRTLRGSCVVTLTVIVCRYRCVERLRAAVSDYVKDDGRLDGIIIKRNAKRNAEGNNETFHQTDNPGE